MAQATIGRLESELRELKMQLQHAKDEVSASAEALRSERSSVSDSASACRRASAADSEAAIHNLSIKILGLA